MMGSAFSQTGYTLIQPSPSREKAIWTIIVFASFLLASCTISSKPSEEAIEEIAQECSLTEPIAEKVRGGYMLNIRLPDWDKGDCAKASLKRRNLKMGMNYSQRGLQETIDLDMSDEKFLKIMWILWSGQTASYEKLVEVSPEIPATLASYCGRKDADQDFCNAVEHTK